MPVLSDEDFDTLDDGTLDEVRGAAIEADGITHVGVD